MDPGHLLIPIRSDRLGLRVAIRGLAHRRRSAFQEVEIVETEVFGRALLLDGHIQLTELDERAYHEALVQLPLIGAPPPRSALVVGGGDGGALRELVKHPSLERIDLVEIDGEVIEACRAHLPGVSDGAFDDPRVRVFVEDAFPFLRETSDSYDLVVLDSSDTYEDEEGALSQALFTADFYRDCRARLREGGLAVTQADNPVFCPYSLESVRAEFGRAFATSGSYHFPVPSFGGYSAFVWGGNGRELPAEWRPLSVGLRVLDEVSYRAAFAPLRFG